MFKYAFSAINACFSTSTMSNYFNCFRLLRLAFQRVYAAPKGKVVAGKLLGLRRHEDFLQTEWSGPYIG